MIKYSVGSVLKILKFSNSNNHLNVQLKLISKKFLYPLFSFAGINVKEEQTLFYTKYSTYWSYHGLPKPMVS